MRLKSIERVWKALVIRGLSALLPSATRRKPPVWGTPGQRILYLRYDRIGDMILASSLVRSIATAHPSLTVDVLASPLNAPVLEGDPHVGSVLIFDRKRPSSYLRTLRELRRARYDAVLDCMVEAPSTTTLLLMLASGARHRIGVGGRSNDFIFTIPVPALASASHYVERTAALAMPFGVDPATTDWRPRIYLTDTERAGAELIWRSQASASTGAGHNRRLLVNISAGKAACTWPDDRFVRTLRLLRSDAPDVQILAVGTPSDAERVASIARAAGVPVARTPGIRSALALVATADFVFTPDTSIVHAASAFGKPAVVMFPRRTNELYGLYRTPGHQVVSTDGTLASLRVEPVVAALTTLLDVGTDSTTNAAARGWMAGPRGTRTDNRPGFYRPDSPLAG
jgi:ADP-heptose:LPS heptosyltransferase